jgi:hypothetical protein
MMNYKLQFARLRLEFMQRALASSLISTIADKHISAIAVMPAKRLAKLF